MNAPAIATLDFVDEHLYCARRMTTAYSRVDPEASAAYPLTDYKKNKLGACGPDPNQLLQRLPFALQAADGSVPLLRQSAHLVTLNVRDLIWRPSDGHAGDTETFKLEELRKQILDAFDGVDMFGCFRPYRYVDRFDVLDEVAPPKRGRLSSRPISLCGGAKLQTCAAGRIILKTGTSTSLIILWNTGVQFPQLQSQGPSLSS